MYTLTIKQGYEKIQFCFETLISLSDFMDAAFENAKKPITVEISYEDENSESGKCEEDGN